MTKGAGKMAVTAAALSLAVIGFTSVPMHAYAQDDGGGTSQNDPANKKIDLDLESTNLYYGLKLLFSQVKANFTIDESLKSLTVTAHLNQVPFRVALETLLKSTGTPLTYKVENGIYSVVPKVEEPAPAEEEKPAATEAPPTGGYKFGIIRPGNLSAIDLVQAFGGHIVSVGYDPKAYTGGMGGMGGMGGFGGGMGGMGGGMGGFGGGMGGMGGFGGGMGGFGGGMGGFGGGYGGGIGGFGGGGYGGGGIGGGYGGGGGGGIGGGVRF